MSISFKGNSPDFTFWVFDINGQTFLARNRSTPDPLRIRFDGGRFFGNRSIGQIVPGATLVKSTSFDITGGTYEGPKGGFEAVGLAEWQWAGQNYISRWTLGLGEVIIRGVPEEGQPDVYDYVLDIVPPYVSKQQLAQEAAKLEAEARAKQAEADRIATEARLRQEQADRDAAEARRRQDQAAADEARRKQEEADRIAAEARRKKEEADRKEAEAKKLADASKATVGSKGEIGVLLVRLGILYALFG